MASAAAGPSTWATATVRFIATTGVGENTVRWPYSATIWCQPVAAASAAPACTALIAAWIWYGPGRLRRRHRRTMAWPPGDEGAIPQRPVLICQQHQSAVPAGTRGPARLGEQYQREQPQHIVSS